ncbi:hypothetical protein ACPCK9_30040 [Streptomyces koyangensis]|uniref:hypothetical protein n=1 Tax=Streptomyces koyangensis TaxID=188770 RepID=UPI0033894947
MTNKDRLPGGASITDVPARYIPPTDPRFGSGTLVISCPICGALHEHGAGEAEQPDYGWRRAHCKSGPGGTYRLIPVGGGK